MVNYITFSAQLSAVGQLRRRRQLTHAVKLQYADS